MPIYEYRCSKCGEFEVMQKITDKPLSKCPSCRSKVSKLMSNTSFQLKGTGWYITDYARSGKAGGAGAKSSDAGGAESKSESSSETKAESKPESKPEAKAASKPEKSGKSKAAA